MERRTFLKANLPSLWEQMFRALDLRGNLPNDVEPPVQGGIQMLDLGKPEYAYLARTNRYCLSVQVAASVGNHSILNCQNTGNAANLLAIIDRITVTNNNAAIAGFGFYTDTAAFGAATQRFCGLDTRSDLSTTVPRPVLLPGTSNGAPSALPAVAPLFAIPAGNVRELITPDAPIVLRPGTSIWIQASSTNSQLDVAVYWRERIASNSEL